MKACRVPVTIYPRVPVEARGEKGVLERLKALLGGRKRSGPTALLTEKGVALLGGRSGKKRTYPISRRGGVWNDIEGPVRWTKWKEAPDHRSQGEKGVLEGQEEPCSVDEMERSGPNGLARVVYPDPRSRGEMGFLEQHEEPC